MKKKIFSIFLIVLLMVGMLIGLTACGNDEDSEKSDKVDYTGMSSPEKLIESFYDEVKDGKTSKAKKYFNIEAMVVCEILEDWDLDFDETYQMMFELDKGADYIKKNYKDFVKAVEDDGVEFDKYTIKKLEEMLKEAEEKRDEAIDNLTGYPDSKIEGIDLEDNYSSIKAKNLEIYEVEVGYDPEESSSETLDVWTVKIDGKYYLVAID